MQEIKVEDVIEVALTAGKKIMEVYGGEFEIEYKSDSSPLTKADEKSNKAINAALQKSYPHIPILSEENQNQEYEIRKGWERLWIVDPLDGTKEFIKGNGEFTVNIALVEAGRPSLGVVYAPAKNTLYFADKEGAYKISADGSKKRLPESFEKHEYVVVASSSHMSLETKAYISGLEGVHKKITLMQSGSSLKICLVAEGAADEYPRLAPTMEWDTAAAHAIVSAAGKKITQYKSGKELTYNKKDLLNPYFIVK
jgi:3'(2'), 5'-bisphosphate nucleotidase